MKLLLQLQFGRAIRAADHVLLQFVTGVIRQLAINLKHDILSYPFTFHRCTFTVHEPCGIAAWAVPAWAKPSRPAPNLPSSHIRQGPAQLLRSAKQSILGSLFRSLQNLTHGSQLQSVVMLQLKHHALARRQLSSAPAMRAPNCRRNKSRSGFAPARTSGTCSSKLYSPPEPSCATGASSLRTFRLRR